jgi:hypothetical protein
MVSSYGNEYLVPALALLLGLIGAVWVSRRRLREPTAFQATALLVGIVVAVSIESWIFGPASFVGNGDEGTCLANAVFFGQIWDGGVFSHDVAGGSNTAVILAKGPEFLSIERWLFALLPTWIANAVMKLLTLGAGASGAYLLARRIGSCARMPAVVLALLVISVHVVYAATNCQGISQLSIGLGALILVGRSGRHRYWPSVLAYSLIYAAGSRPAGDLTSTMTVLLCVALINRDMRWGRAIAAVAVLLVATFLNWANVIAGIGIFAPESARASLVNLSRPWSDIPDLVLDTVLGNRLQWFLPLFLLGLPAIVRRQPLWALRGAIASALPMVGGAVLATVPFAGLGLGFLQSYDWRLMGLAAYWPMLIVAARALALWPAMVTAERPRRLALSLVVLLAVAAFGRIKIENAVTFLGEGGIANFTSIPNLRRPTWLETAPFPVRTVTVPFRLTSTMVESYGIPTFDGVLNLYPLARGEFWINGLNRRGTPDLRDNTVIISRDVEVDWRCCDRYRLWDYVDPDMLRLANVGFILSRVPLVEEGLRKVSGPDDADLPPRRGWSLARKLTGYLSLALMPQDVFVYRLSDPLPLVFSPTGLDEVGDDLSPSAFYDRVRSLYPSGVAVVRRADAPAVAPIGQVSILSYRQVVDGYEISVAADQPGMVVVNTPWVRFWRARDQAGRPLAVSRINGIQTGIAVPAGIERIELQYSFPLASRLLWPGRAG